jgi:transcriptional antiterminator RfaH
MADPDMRASHDPWYLVQLKPNGYTRAVTNLSRQDVATFMPLTRRRADKGKGAASGPLFPGYLFVNFDPMKISFTSVNSTFGVLRIVTTGCSIERGVPLKLIKGLQSRCDEFGYLVPIDDLKKDELVRITAGPFKRFVATVDQMKSRDRVQVLFDIMGQSVRAEFSTDDLERAKAS